MPVFPSKKVKDEWWKRITAYNWYNKVLSFIPGVKTIFYDTFVIAYGRGRDDCIKEIKESKTQIMEGRLLNERVICRSNEDDELMIGKCTKVDRITRERQPVPIVRDEKDGNEYLVMGIVILYSEEMMELLSKKSPTEQWDFLAKNKFNLNQ